MSKAELFFSLKVSFESRLWLSISVKVKCVVVRLPPTNKNTKVFVPFFIEKHKGSDK